MTLVDLAMVAFTCLASAVVGNLAWTRAMGRILLILFVCIALTGCAGPPAAPVDARDPHFPTVSFLQAHDHSRLDDCVLVSESSATRPIQVPEILPIRFDQLWEYARRYSAGGNDCPQGQLNSDCAHFQAHCLAAAGIRVGGATATCEAGLTLRVRDLAIAFDNASVRYANVKKIRDYQAARRGDWCFLPREANPGGRHDHLMLLAAAPEQDGARVYSHTNNRTGDFVPFDAEDCLYYRIESPVAISDR